MLFTPLPKDEVLTQRDLSGEIAGLTMQSHRPPKLLLFFNPAGLMDRDMVSSLEHAGLQVHVEPLNLSETSEGHSVERFAAEDLERTLDRYRPDLILSFNGRGLDNAGDLSQMYARRGIPFATWFVDRPYALAIEGRYDKQNTYIFMFDAAYLPRIRAAGFDHAFYLPLATNPARFRPLADITPANTVCFVGDSDYTRIQYFARNIDALLQEPGEAFYEAMETAVDRQLASPGQSSGDLIAPALSSRGLNPARYAGILQQLMEAFVEREAGLRQRLAVIQTLNERFDLAVYGDVLWEKVVGNRYHGYADYFSDAIVQVYNRYAVQINVSRFQLEHAINQRPFDVAACGGFLLTDDRPAVHEIFAPDEISVYHDLDEMCALTAYYLAHPELRRQQAERARRKVLAAHTYAHRIAEIMRCVLG